MAKIKSIKLGEYDIDSFVIIPGVTNYCNIYSMQNMLIFENKEWQHTIKIDFVNEGELDRFFTQLFREIKINQITNVSVDTKTK